MKTWIAKNGEVMSIPKFILGIMIFLSIITAISIGMHYYFIKLDKVGVIEYGGK